MNRTLPLILTAALLLTACASAVPAQPADATTSPDAAASSPAQPDAAASSPSQPAAETSVPPLTPKFPVGHLLTLPQNQNSGPVWNTGRQDRQECSHCGPQLQEGHQRRHQPAH